MNRKKYTPLAALAGLALAAGSAHGALLVYEGFDYATTGNVPTSDATVFNGGTGFSNGWTGTTTNVPWSIGESSGLEFDGLTTTGNRVLTRSTAPGGGEVSRTLSVTSSMTASTLYFSVLFRPEWFSVGNENLSMLFGAADTINPNVSPVTSSGEALGFGTRGGTPDNFQFQALGIENGVTVAGALGGQVLRGDNNNATIQMFYGKIEWAPKGTNDTLTLFKSDTNNDISSFSQISTVSVDVDESLFTTLHIAGQQISSIDEIRFGTTLTSVGVIPEPTTALLGGIGMLFLLRRRR